MVNGTVQSVAGGSALAETFDAVYQDAGGDSSRVPWSDGVANPALVTWLNVVAPRLVRCGSRVAVVGCGLGEDARELIRRGFDVTAFDVSPTAIDWARAIDPGHRDVYQRADLFDMPTRWRHRFDLVVEIYTIQALPPNMREATVQAMSELLGPHGHLLTICRGCEESVVGLQDEMPWPLTPEELLSATAAAGLVPDGSVDAFMDREDPPKLRLRAVFHRT